MQSKKKSVILITTDGKFGKFEFDNTQSIFPKMKRIAEYGERTPYKGKEISDILLGQKIFEKMDKDKLVLEICPSCFFDKFGRSLNMIFVTGLDFVISDHKDLITYQNNAGIYFIKYRCPYGACIFYDECTNLGVDDMETIKKEGEIPFCLTTTFAHNTEIKNKEKSVDAYIQKFYSMGIIHHEIFKIYLEKKMKGEYVLKGKSYYEIFNSYSMKFMDHYVIGLLVGSETGMRMRYRPGKTLDFKNKNGKNNVTQVKIPIQQ